MTDGPIYLDHNATTPVAPEVAESMWPYLTEHFGNPSSASVQGRIARQAIEGAREQVAALIDARPEEIVFTSGGTESNNLAIRGVAAHASTSVAVTSAIEHPATVGPLAHLRDRHGWTLQMLPVDDEARVRPEDLPAGEIGLGTLILAHNEIGSIQPMAQIAERVRAAGGAMHADAAQAVGKIPVSVEQLGVDLLSIAGHKLYAPKGVGALYIRRGTRVAPVVLGAGQEHGLRPGTENVASIVGLGTAAELAAQLLTKEHGRQEQLRERLWNLLKVGATGLVRISPKRDVLPNTLMVAVPGLLGADVLNNAHGVGASTGSACHAGIHEPSAALVAMNVPTDAALGALRLSLGRNTTESDVDRAAALIVKSIETLRPTRTRE